MALYRLQTSSTEENYSKSYDFDNLEGAYKTAVLEKMIFPHREVEIVDMTVKPVPAVIRTIK